MKRNDQGGLVVLLSEIGAASRHPAFGAGTDVPPGTRPARMVCHRCGSQFAQAEMQQSTIVRKWRCPRCKSTKVSLKRRYR
jgi:DNA-directed RNA polymerase subunit RPC12/RpoP